MKYGRFELAVIATSLAAGLVYETIDSTFAFFRWYRSNWPMRWTRRIAMVLGVYAFAVIVGWVESPSRLKLLAVVASGG